ncbi:class I SAM-dependent methyltransferase [Aspergillus clavatus NRRL 1]|uniref:Methyltransferase domain-containing protein n=1 Tax=Aspergillus clavatus (strain ATCC 1007 / CBS 513.65 / DSM 816 / NCTC 3887 / NRRL 1 / QM 1276 / 107) TaxID=344612 RepID=A1CS76_ASPCL|nr:uncharacterized protein ACLA_032320 [Aspergillus clavatus NRRL 1]EAW08497.1 hypothetical protein ACLA_032320 [Aspergillus clavatus NRRL 1]
MPAHSRRNRDVLDLAYGMGFYSRHFAKAGARKVLGIDIFNAMVASVAPPGP